ETCSNPRLSLNVAVTCHRAVRGGRPGWPWTPRSLRLDARLKWPLPRGRKRPALFNRQEVYHLAEFLALESGELRAIGIALRFPHQCSNLLIELQVQDLHLLLLFIVEWRISVFQNQLQCWKAAPEHDLFGPISPQLSALVRTQYLI